jgi:hypothetical protein
VLSSSTYGWGLDDLNASAAVAEVPEPATVGMLALGLAVVLGARRKRKA